MIKEVIITYIVVLMYDLPMILNNKMYNNLFLSINDNNKLTLNNSIYISIFLTYLFISFGIYYFVIKNSTNFNESLIQAFIFGIILMVIVAILE